MVAASDHMMATTITFDFVCVMDGMACMREMWCSDRLKAMTRCKAVEACWECLKLVKGMYTCNSCPGIAVLLLIQSP